MSDLSRDAAGNSYARHLVASLASTLLPARNGKFRQQLIKQLLPYCLSPVPDGRWILLNREYKPIGWPVARTGRIDYARPEFASLLVTPNLQALANLHHQTNNEGTRFAFLYGNDTGRPPWASVAAANAYVVRLGAVLDIRAFSAAGASP
jgi:hypothetical protein